MTPGTPSPHTIILIDVGNTRIKAGWVDPASGAREPAALAIAHSQSHELAAWLADQGLRAGAAVGVNVAGAEKARPVADLIEQTLGLPLHWACSGPCTLDVGNAYLQPGQLGADRWVSMLGLALADPAATTPLLLASFGTATTIDLLCPAPMATGCTHGATARDLRWIYEGGLILPGPALMRSSLAAHTAQLPNANGMITAFPLDTHQAIVSGIAASQAGAVIRQWQAGLARYGVAPKVFCTGGDWPSAANELQDQLAQAQRLNGVAAQPAIALASPILDGLARIALAQEWDPAVAPSGIRP